MLADILISQETFDSLYQATLAIASAETLDKVLQQIVDSARELAGADYAAISVSDDTDLLALLITSNVSREVAAQVAQTPSGRGVVGRLFRDKKPIRASRLSEDPDSAGFPDGLQAMDSFLGVPIMADQTVLGNLYLANKIGMDGFSHDDQKLVEMLAAHAAVAIRKATLLKEQAETSRRVEERNRQLAALNRATLAITGELALDKVLQQIVDSARELASAEYGALGVPNADGALETFVYSGMSAEEAALMPHFPKGRGLLGAIIRERRAIRIPRLSGDPRSVGFPPGHPGMESFLGVPVTTGGEMLGNLYLTNKISATEFSTADQELVEMLAAHAAIVIQNSRLYEQIGRLAIVAERARIGMDLHDGVIQSIYAVGLTLESVRLSLPENRDEADKLLAQSIEGLNDTIRDIRNFILDLRPHRFSGDLQQGLARLVREFQANTMIPVTLSMSLNASLPVSPPVARAIFLTAQEALANVARHARASQVVVEAQQADSAFELAITDDGRGFDAKVQVQTVGHGLSNMRARAESLEGSFALKSSPGQGTSIKLTLPCC
jgi:two-component system sensor histidine kinase DevS